MTDKVIGYIYNSEGRYSYQIWFTNTIDNIANFIFQTRYASKVMITDTNDIPVAQYTNNNKISLGFIDELIGLSESFEELCRTHDSNRISDLVICHGEYDTSYLKTYLNNKFKVEML